MTLSLSDEHIFVFIDATVQAVTILSSSMLQSKLWLSVFIDATVSHDFLTPLWGLVTTAGARKSYTSVARKLGNGLTGELVLKFSTECVYIWHMEFTSGFSKPVNCLRVKGKKTLGFTSTETIIKGLFGTGKLGGQEFYILQQLVTLSPPEWFCIKAGSCVSHFDYFHSCTSCASYSIQATTYDI